MPKDLKMGFQCKSYEELHYRYTIDTEINRYVSIRSSCCIDTDDGDSSLKTTTIIILEQNLLVSHLTFNQLSKRLKHIEFFALALAFVRSTV